MGADLETEGTDDSSNESVGTRLAAAREAKGLSLDDISEITRIPIRHLKVVEKSDWQELPARTYALGFSRSFAKAVGMDHTEIADQVRQEMGVTTRQQERAPRVNFEPGDPSRVPSRRLAWFGAFAAIMLGIGAFAYFGDYFVPGSGPPSLISLGGDDEDKQTTAPDKQAAEAAPSPQGTVVFTALEDNVWVRFSDADGERLFEKMMTKGEKFTLPANANAPELNTGRPDALAITIGGKSVPKLAEEPTTMGAAPVSAQALLGRGALPQAQSAQPVPVQTGN